MLKKMLHYAFYPQCKNCKKVFDYDIFECPEELKGQLKIGDFFG